MTSTRRIALDELSIRPGTYYNPQTEVLIVVDDSPEVDQEIFATEEFDATEWVQISEELPVDEDKRDDLIEHFRVTYKPAVGLIACRPGESRRASWSVSLGSAPVAVSKRAALLGGAVIMIAVAAAPAEAARAPRAHRDAARHGPSVSAALLSLKSSGAISASDYSRDYGAYVSAKRALTKLSGTRRTELGAVLDN